VCGVQSPSTSRIPADFPLQVGEISIVKMLILSTL